MNFKRLLFFTLIFIAVLFANFAYGQDGNKIAIPQLTPPAPNATALAQYADVPVSKYSGVPNISIPIYTIDTDGFQLPINLSYHASGIKVAQEASSAGLGWVLNTGGVITRQIRGIEDFSNVPGVKDGFLVSPELPEYQNFEGFEEAVMCPYITTQTFLGDFVHMHINNINYACAGFFYKDGFETNNSYDPNGELSNVPDFSQKADTESDLYTFNFAGFSGKFVVNKDGSTVLYAPESGLTIELIDNDSWQVTDNKGIKYIFSEKEYTIPHSYNKDHYEEGLLYLYGSNTGGTRHISSWYLSKIILPGIPNSQTIDFHYNQLETESWSFGPITVNRAMPVPGHNECSYDIPKYNSYNKQYTKNSSVNTMESYLESITWKNGSVNFSYLGREDLFYGNNQPLRFDEISIENNQKEVSHVKFDMSYFNNQDLNNPRKHFSLRLKLDGVTIGDKKYEFNYDRPNALPPKYSVGHDHWGYYNAQENLSDHSYYDQIQGKWIDIPYFLPELMVTDYSVFEKDSLFAGANRESNLEATTIGILKSIEYPTKGVVNFEYEPNKFKLSLHPLSTSYGLLKYEDKYEDTSYHVVNYAQTANDCQCGYEDNPAEQFVITETTTVEVGFEYHPYGSIQNPPVPIDENGNGSVFGHLIRTDGGESFSKDYRFVPGDIAHTYTEEIVLNPGTYILGTSSAEHFTIMGTARITIDHGLDNSKEMIGGGVRIKKIISEKNTREFLYHKYENEQETSGRLMVEPYYSFFNWGMFQCSVAFMRNSSATFPLSESASGATVGYSCVQEVISDGNDRSIHLSKFINKGEPQVRGSNLPMVLQYENGLLKEELYQSNDRVISKNVYDYDEPLGIQFPETYFVRINFAFGNYYSVNYYGADPEWWKLESKSTFDYFYDSLGNRKTVSTITDYQYNLENYQVSQTNSIGSDGDEIITKTYYPDDVSGVSSLSGGNLTTQEYNAIDMLKAIKNDGTEGLHHTAVPIQIETYKNGVKLSTQRMTYKYLGNDLVVLDRVLTSKRNAPLVPRLLYEKYDLYGNPTEVRKVDGFHMAYLWGYNGQYPVAKVENATYVEVMATGVDLTVLGSTSSTESAKLAELNKIRNHSSMSNAMVTTYTYDPLVGVSTVTDPRGVKTSYDYDSFNRLEFIKDETGKLLEEYKYHYKN